MKKYDGSIAWCRQGIRDNRVGFIQDDKRFNMARITFQSSPEYYVGR